MKNFFRFLRETSRETSLAAAMLALIVFLFAVMRLVDSGPQPAALAWTVALLQQIAPALFRLYLAVIVGWGLFRLLFPTLAEFGEKNGFANDWGTMRGLDEPMAANAFRRCVLTASALAFCFLIAAAFLFFA